MYEIRYVIATLLIFFSFQTNIFLIFFYIHPSQNDPTLTWWEGSQFFEIFFIISEQRGSPHCSAGSVSEEFKLTSKFFVFLFSPLIQMNYCFLIALRRATYLRGSTNFLFAERKLQICFNKKWFETTSLIIFWLYHMKILWKPLSENSKESQALFLPAVSGLQGRLVSFLGVKW